MLDDTFDRWSVDCTFTPVVVVVVVVGRAMFHRPSNEDGESAPVARHSQGKMHLFQHKERASTPGSNDRLDGQARAGQQTSQAASARQSLRRPLAPPVRSSRERSETFSNLLKPLDGAQCGLVMIPYRTDTVPLAAHVRTLTLPYTTRTATTVRWILIEARRDSACTRERERERERENRERRSSH
jgi:hypothetical protein